MNKTWFCYRVLHSRKRTGMHLTKYVLKWSHNVQESVGALRRAWPDQPGVGWKSEEFFGGSGHTARLSLERLLPTRSGIGKGVLVPGPAQAKSPEVKSWPGRASLEAAGYVAGGCQPVYLAQKPLGQPFIEQSPSFPR